MTFSESAPAGAGGPAPRPGATHPSLTVRAVATGMALGAILSWCNIYASLKVGLSFNMSIPAALLGFGWWRLLGWARLGRNWGLLENTISQTAASSGAAVASAGLVAPIPALALLTGQTLSWPALTIWVLSVCLVGIVVALLIRNQLIIREGLPFAAGAASAETLREIHNLGGRAVQRLRYFWAGALWAIWAVVVQHQLGIGPLQLPAQMAARAHSMLRHVGLRTIRLQNLAVAFDPSLMLVGIGALIGVKISASMLVGSLVAWLGLAPLVLDLGWVVPKVPRGDAVWFGSLVKWLVWPGVALMVTGSLIQLALSWRSFAAVVKGSKPRFPIPANWRGPFWVAAGMVWVASIILQICLFGISWWLALLSLVSTLALAMVAGRVSGETSISPVGPMGKVTQLVFGLIAPGQPATNLMAANVTGGAATQCADLLHDLKTGHVLGARPHHQVVAQVVGAVAGAMAGCAAYLVLLPHPQQQLLTPQWPAPAAASWKAVAEIFQVGLSGMPPGAIEMIGICGALGVALALARHWLPRSISPWVPNPTSMGLAFVIPAAAVLPIALGALLAALASRYCRTWTSRFLVVLAAGFIAGESLSGVGVALLDLSW